MGMVRMRWHRSRSVLVSLQGIDVSFPSRARSRSCRPWSHRCASGCNSSLLSFSVRAWVWMGLWVGWCVYPFHGVHRFIPSTFPSGVLSSRSFSRFLSGPARTVYLGSSVHLALARMSAWTRPQAPHHLGSLAPLTASDASDPTPTGRMAEAGVSPTPVPPPRGGMGRTGAGIRGSASRCGGLPRRRRTRSRSTGWSEGERERGD